MSLPLPGTGNSSAPFKGKVIKGRKQLGVGSRGGQGLLEDGKRENGPGHRGDGHPLLGPVPACRSHGELAWAVLNPAPMDNCTSDLFYTSCAHKWSSLQGPGTLALGGHHPALSPNSQVKFCRPLRLYEQ